MFPDQILIDEKNYLAVFHSITPLNFGTCIEWLRTFKGKEMEAFWKTTFVSG